MEAPEDWNLPWIRRHGLEKRPEHHDKYNVVKNEQAHDSLII